MDKLLKTLFAIYILLIFTITAAISAFNPLYGLGFISVFGAMHWIIIIITGK